MSTLDERREIAFAGTDGGTNGWATRIVLQPIAAPSVLGLMGFSVATFMVASIQAKWWGTEGDLLAVAPFAAMFGGVAQFAAGLWAYKARDVVATLAHGMWGAFWMAFFAFELMDATGLFDRAGINPPWVLGLWFFGLAFATTVAALGALTENLGIFTVLATLATGSAFSAAGFMTGGFGSGWSTAGGWLFVFSAGFALYSALAMTLMGVTGKAILPTGELKKKANKPGAKTIHPIELDWAEPGVKQGQ